MKIIKPHIQVFLGAPHSGAALQKPLEASRISHGKCLKLLSSFLLYPLSFLYLTQRHRAAEKVAWARRQVLGAPHSGAALQKSLKEWIALPHADKVRALLEKLAWARRRVRAFLLGAPHSGAALQKSLKEWKALPHAETQRRRGIEYKSGNRFHLINLILPFVYYLLSPSSFILFKPLTRSQRHGVFFREHRHPAGNINLQITQVNIDRIYMLYRNLFPSAPLPSARDLFPNEFCSNKYWGKE